MKSELTATTNISATQTESFSTVRCGSVPLGAESCTIPSFQRRDGGEGVQLDLRRGIEEGCEGHGLLREQQRLQRS